MRSGEMIIWEGGLGNSVFRESTLSPDVLEAPAEQQDADHGGADEDRVAEEVPRDAGQRAPQAVLLKLHPGSLRTKTKTKIKKTTTTTTSC